MTRVTTFAMPASAMLALVSSVLAANVKPQATSPTPSTAAVQNPGARGPRSSPHTKH